MAKKKASMKLRFERKLIRAVSPAVEQLMAPPKLDGIKRALFIQPHPDDNQIGAGGTIAALIAQGAEVFELTALDDRFVDLSYSGEGLTHRQKEALAAQECLGMKNAGFLGFGDRTQATMREVADAITLVIRKIQPDAVFTVDPNLENECHEDHIKISRAVQTAVVDAAIGFLPEYQDGKLREDVWRVKTIGFYFTDKPNTIVDIAPYEEVKLKAIQCHVSQQAPGLILSTKMVAQQFAVGTEYEAVEALRMISSLHTHCFPMPVG